MNIIRLFPVFFSFLLIAAHFQRAGLILFSTLSLCAPALLYFTRKWSVQIIQLLLILASLEWLRTLVVLVQYRYDSDLPFIRLALILSAVTLFTAASSLVFLHPKLKVKYFNI